MGLASKLKEAEAQRAATAAQGGAQPGFAPPGGPPPPQMGQTGPQAGYAPPLGAPPPGHPGAVPNFAPPAGPPPSGPGAPGAPPRAQPAAGAPASAVSYGAILEQLQACVRDQNIAAFYPAGSLEHIARDIERKGVIPQVASQWRLPITIATELAKMALFDFVLYIDDSGSMRKDDRIDQLKNILGRVAFATSLFDADGYSLRFINANLAGENIRTPAEALALVENPEVAWRYQTPLGTQMYRRILEPMLLRPAKAGQLSKPLVVVTITDGKPEGEQDNNSHMIFDVIKNANQHLRKTRYGPDAVSYQFAQVGDDLQAAAFLSELDENRDIGNLVDCTSSYEVEQAEMSRVGVDLTPELWVMKLLMGPIDSSYDEKDERKQPAPSAAPGDKKRWWKR